MPFASASRVVRFAADQPVLAAAAVRAGYAAGEAIGTALLELAAAAAELHAARAGGPLPRVADPTPWQEARAADLSRAELELVAAIDPAWRADRALLDAAAPILLALAHAAAQVPARPSPRLPDWLAVLVVRARSSLAPERDDAIHLPRRIRARVWLLTLFAVIAVYFFKWSVVHVAADIRPCLGQLDDPLHRLIQLDPRWSVVSHDLYVAVLLTTIAVMFAVAALGDHRPIVRWGMALAVVAVLRSATIWLVPLCQVGVEAGTSRLAELPWIDVGPLRVLWRAFASNDLLFSGHMAECILALRATRSWPRALRAAMWVFLVAQAYALLATRGHYTVDLLVAVPMAYLADRVALGLVARLCRPQPGRRPPRRF
jgi:hypothetical protein